MGEQYWHVGGDGNVYCNVWDSGTFDHIFDIAMLSTGNCFRTEEQAQGAIPIMLEKFKKILSGDMVLVEKNRITHSD